MHNDAPEPIREKGEPSMAFRGRLMFWTLDAPDGRRYEDLDFSERSRWTMLAASLEKDILPKAPYDSSGAGGGFTAHTGGPGVVGPAEFSTAQ